MKSSYRIFFYRHYIAEVGFKHQSIRSYKIKCSFTISVLFFVLDECCKDFGLISTGFCGTGTGLRGSDNGGLICGENSCFLDFDGTANNSK